MPISFDSVSNSGEVNSGMPPFEISWSHTCAGTDRLLVVGVAMTDPTNTIASITYNGVALTKIREEVNTNDNLVSLWYLTNPASGANTILVTVNTSFTNGVGMAVSLTGVDQTSPLDANNGTSADLANSVSVDVTTVADNCWVVDVVIAKTGGGTFTVGAGQTSRATVESVSADRGMSTEGPKTPAGAVTMSWDESGGMPSDNWSIAAASFKPVGVAAAGQDLRPLLGVS